MNSAIDACETVEELNITEEHRSLMNDDSVTIWDFLQSAWTYPEKHNL